MADATQTRQMPLLMRAKEACRALAISRWTLQRYVRAGLIRTVKPLGQVRFVADDVCKLADPDRQQGMLRPSEAGELLGVGAAAVRRMADSGKIRSMRTPGGQLRVAADDVESFLERQGVRHVGSVSQTR